MSLRSLAATVLGVTAVPKGGASCQTDEDCHLNGECQANLLMKRCVCDAAWTGESCGELHLLAPATKAASRLAPHPADQSGWGGGALEIDGDWHLYVSEFSNHCGLNSWGTNSLIRHSVSKDGLEGPYLPQDVTLPVQAHNPSAARLPNGTLLMYHIGSGHVEQPEKTNCADGKTFDKTRRSPPSSKVTGGLLASEDPSGPWRSLDIAKFDNPSPWVLENGSMLLMHVIRYQPPDNVTQCGQSSGSRTRTGIAVADAPEGPYWPLGGRIGDDVTVPLNMADECNAEDPHIWRDQRGNWHALFHDQASGPWVPEEYQHTRGKIGHAFSRDLLHWTYSKVLAATGAVSHADGSNADYNSRERPHLILDPKTGAPTHFVSAVKLDVADPPTPNCTWYNQPGCDVSFTHIQRLNQESDVQLV